MTDWKRTEREVGKHLGGTRVPITGRQRGSAPDVEHEWLSIEVKHRKKLPEWLHDAMDQAVKSQKNGQVPIVVLHQSGKHHDNDYVVLKMSDFADWFGNA